MTVRDFVGLLWESFSPSIKNIDDGNLLHYGRTRYWLEDIDEEKPENSLDKRTAARIIHQFMRMELGIKDIPDVAKARELKDLYTCRICTAHVAQVYVRGIMDAEDFMDSDGQYVRLFNMTEPVDDKTARQIIERVKALVD